MRVSLKWVRQTRRSFDWCAVVPMYPACDSCLLSKMNLPFLFGDPLRKYEPSEWQSGHVTVTQDRARSQRHVVPGRSLGAIQVTANGPTFHFFGFFSRPDAGDLTGPSTPPIIRWHMAPHPLHR